MYFSCVCEYVSVVVKGIVSFLHIPLFIDIRFWVWTLSQAYELKINEKFGVQNQISFCSNG